jgi:hypothetical protein
MAEFRVFFIDNAGKVSGKHEFVLLDDESARIKARALFPGKRLEIWEGTRLVERVDGDPAPPSPLIT